MSGFTDRADAALADPILKIAVERTAGTAEAKRAIAVDAFPDFEAARTRAAAIKDDVIAHLGPYLEQFEASAIAAGAQVHWAQTADEACRIVIDMFVEKITGLTRATEDEAAFLQQQLDSMWEEHGRFAIYTAGAAELIERGKRDRERAAEAEADRIALASVTQDAAALREHIAVLRRKIEARDKAMGKLVRRAEKAGGKPGTGGGQTG